MMSIWRRRDIAERADGRIDQGQFGRRRPTAAQNGGPAAQKMLCLTEGSPIFVLAPHSSSEMMAKSAEPVTIKKYANRRLYNTGTSTYVTLEDLAAMVKNGEDFIVYDAKSGEDITRSVLTQIIFEQENKEGQNLLPITFLRQLIRFYGDSMQMVVPRYLEHTMQYFASNQEQMRNYMRDTFGGMFPFGRFEDLGKQNIAFFERALKMFAPFQGEERDPERTEPAGNPGTDATALSDLKSQLDVLQKRIDSLSRQKGGDKAK